MRVKRLTLDNYRNYPRIELDFGPGVNVLSGDNGQGKTNILESIYLCSCARSHRTARDSELILKGEDYYRVSLLYDNNDYLDQTIQLTYLAAIPGSTERKASSRRFYFNDVLHERIADLYGLFNAVIFAPEDLMLIKDGPQTRRRFMDLLLSQVKPAYFGDLSLFTRLLNQRNRLLKMIRDQHPELKGSDFDLMQTQLEVWNEQYAEVAARLIAERFRLVERIHLYAKEYQAAISEDKEVLTIRYRTMSGLKPEMEIAKIEELIAKRLEQQTRDDIYRGNTGIGPHRDDLDIYLNDSPLKTFGSQGQQRTAVLALKLAELRLVKEWTGEMPVLLLDDVMSELDINRRSSLVGILRDYQVFITCTDTQSIQAELSALANADEINYFHVEAGTVKPLG